MSSTTSWNSFMFRVPDLFLSALLNINAISSYKQGNRNITTLYLIIIRKKAIKLYIVWLYHDFALVYSCTVTKSIDIFTPFNSQPFISGQCTPVILFWTNQTVPNSKYGKIVVQKHLYRFWSETDLTDLLHEIHNLSAGSDASWPDNHPVRQRHNLATSSFLCGDFLISYFHHHWACLHIDAISLEFLFSKSSDSLVKPVSKPNSHNRLSLSFEKNKKNHPRS